MILPRDIFHLVRGSNWANSILKVATHILGVGQVNFGSEPRHRVERGSALFENWSQSIFWVWARSVVIDIET